MRRSLFIGVRRGHETETPGSHIGRAQGSHRSRSVSDLGTDDQRLFNRFFFLERVSCSPGYPQTPYIAVNNFQSFYFHHPRSGALVYTKPSLYSVEYQSQGFIP